MNRTYNMNQHLYRLTLKKSPTIFLEFCYFWTQQCFNGLRVTPPLSHVTQLNAMVP